MYDEIYALVDIMRIEIKHEALAKIARRAAHDAEIGMRRHDITRDRLRDTQNKYNTKILQNANRQLSMWRNRNRTCK